MNPIHFGGPGPVREAAKKVIGASGLTIAGFIAANGGSIAAAIAALLASPIFVPLVTVFGISAVTVWLTDMLTSK